MSCRTEIIKYIFLRTSQEGQYRLCLQFSCPSISLIHFFKMFQSISSGIRYNLLRFCRIMFECCNPHVSVNRYGYGMYLVSIHKFSSQTRCGMPRFPFFLNTLRGISTMVVHSILPHWVVPHGKSSHSAQPASYSIPPPCHTLTSLMWCLMRLQLCDK